MHTKQRNRSHSWLSTCFFSSASLQQYRRRALLIDLTSTTSPTKFAFTAVPHALPATIVTVAASAQEVPAEVDVPEIRSRGRCWIKYTLRCRLGMPTWDANFWSTNSFRPPGPNSPSSSRSPPVTSFDLAPQTVRSDAIPLPEPRRAVVAAMSTPVTPKPSHTPRPTYAPPTSRPSAPRTPIQWRQEQRVASKTPLDDHRRRVPGVGREPVQRAWIPYKRPRAGKQVYWPCKLSHPPNAQIQGLYHQIQLAATEIRSGQSND